MEAGSHRDKLRRQNNPRAPKVPTIALLGLRTSRGIRHPEPRTRRGRRLAA